jgi:amino acid transporter
MEGAREQIPPTAAQGGQLAKSLGRWDAVSIIVGIVIGSTIFRSPPDIMKSVSGPWMGLGVWAIGGILSLVGALCYAELASTYPRSGGDYVYLTRAFGPWAGFLFGWAQLTVIRTGSVGAMGFVFADYAVQLWPFEVDKGWLRVLAGAAVAVLTFMNILGVIFGKWVQNLLTAAKVLGLGGILVAGLGWSQPGAWVVEGSVEQGGLGLAMIFVLYAFGGWNDSAMVAAELRGRRDIVFALIIGIAAITVIYLAINAAYVLGLGFEGVLESKAVAAKLLEKPLGRWGAGAMSILVMISALGTINGTIFTGSRVYASLGADYRLFAWLGRWHPRRQSPVAALLAQGLISLVMIAGVGSASGFEDLVIGTAPVFWGFFLLSGLALLVLRRRDPQIERPFSVPWFPVLPVVFCATCSYMLYASLTFARERALFGGIPLLLGLPLFWLSYRRADHEHAE